MPEILIQADGLGKRYIIGHQAQRERYTALRDVLMRGARTFFRKASDFAHGRAVIEGDELEEVWALRDVSFEVKRGEVLGIIGRNGAGKSTLLKILSRITEPTTGRVMLRGRVASLLEVGTGFHPELTGRENIFLNGAILGMTRAEIRERFDEIAAFAEVERFLDTPVKRYSSGMYVRLAFAVAAHLEPEILIVDEVLAVGDAEFQRKCLGRMSEVAREGRTVLFVSHNMGAVQTLCSTGIVLEGGRVSYTGAAGHAVASYMGTEDLREYRWEVKALSASLELRRLEVHPSRFRRGTDARLHIEIAATGRDIISDLAVLVHSPSGDRVALIDLRSDEGPFRMGEGDLLVLDVGVQAIPLVEMKFSIGLYVNADSVCTSFMNLGSLDVLPSSQVSQVPPRDPQFRGVVELETEVRYRVERQSFEAQ